MKKVISLILILTLVFSFSAFAEYDFNDVLNDSGNIILTTVPAPMPQSIGGEWSVIGIARGGFSYPLSFINSYKENLTKKLKDNNGILSTRKNTEYMRAILALNAIGENPENFMGYNVVNPILDVAKTKKQGLNGSIWALISLNSKDFNYENIKEEYLNIILNSQNENGSFSLTKGGDENPDITAMALQALSFYKERSNVKNVTEKALNYLSSLQDDKGGFIDCNLTSQVVVALAGLKIPVTDKRFIKGDKNYIDGLISYYRKNKGFLYKYEDKDINLMATEQALYALVAYDRFIKDKNFLYDMRDVYNFSLKKDFKNEDKNFSDILDNPFKNEILSLAKRGIINGKTKDLFCPEDKITRGEFVTLISNIIDCKSNINSDFFDVKESDWFYPYVKKSVSAGLIKGFEGYFNPNGEITLAESATIIKRMYENLYKKEDIKREFNNIPDYANESLSFVKQKGFLKSNRENLKYNTPILRSETAKLIYEFLEVK